MFTNKELIFSTFIFYSLSERWNKTPAEVYKILDSTGILDGYIIEAYDVLHTLGKEYLIEDITGLLREQGICVIPTEPEDKNKILRIHKRELENKIIYNIADMKKDGLRKAMDIYYSGKIPNKVANANENIEHMDVYALAKEAIKRKKELQR